MGGAGGTRLGLGARQRHLEDLPCRGVFNGGCDRDAAPLLDRLDPVQVRRVDAHRPVQLLVLFPLACGAAGAAFSAQGRCTDTRYRHAARARARARARAVAGAVARHRPQPCLSGGAGAPEMSSMTGSPAAAMRAAAVGRADRWVCVRTRLRAFTPLTRLPARGVPTRPRPHSRTRAVTSWLLPRTRHPSHIILWNMKSRFN